jgi:hypothetical protein
MEFVMSSPDDNNLSPHPTPAPIKDTKPASSNWPLGLAIVVIGGLLLARNLGFELFFLDFHNWWAFFIFLAAIGPFQFLSQRGFRCRCCQFIGVSGGDYFYCHDVFARSFIWNLVADFCDYWWALYDDESQP